MKTTELSPIDFRSQFGSKRTRLISLLCVMLICCGSSCWGQFKYNPNALVPFDPVFKMGKLDNGIQYFVCATKIQKGEAYFYDLFNVGECQETQQERGVAHFIEHLIAYFNENGFNQYGNFLKMGKTSHAGTGPGGTHYDFFHISTQKESTLDSMLLILKDIPFQLNTGHNVEKQRKSVLAELKMRNTSDSEKEDSLILMTLKRTEYSSLCNYILETTTVSQVTPLQLKQFHNKWYRPENLTVVAVGDFDAERMEAKVKQIFGAIPKSQDAPALIKYPSIPQLTQPIILIDNNNEVKSGQIELHFKLDREFPFNQQQLRNKIMDDLIRNMLQNRFSQTDFDSESVLSDATAEYDDFYYSSIPRWGEFILKAQSSDPLKGMAGLLKIREQVRRYGFLPDELQQAKHLLLNGFQSEASQKSILPCDEYFYIVYSFVVSGVTHPSAQYQYAFAKEVVPTISLKEVNDRFNMIIANQQPSVSVSCKRLSVQPTESEVRTLIASVKNQHILPYKIQKKSNLVLFDRKVTSGKVIKQRSNKILNTTEWTLSNGLKVVIKTTDFNDNEIQFEGLRNRALLSLNEEYFPSLLFGDMLLEKMGLDHYTSGQVNQLLTGKYLSVKSQLLPQTQGILYGEKQGIFGCTVPKDIETCLQLINLHFNHQRWNDEFLKKEIEQIKKGSKVVTPETVMNDTTAYYSNTGRGIFHPLYNIECLSLERLKRFFYTVFNDPADFTFFFSGNIKAEEVKPLIEKYLGSIKPNKGGGADNEFLDQKIPSTNETWKTGRVSHQFCYPMQTPVAEISISCFGETSAGILCRELTSHLLTKRFREFVGEKNEATYTIGNTYITSVGKESPVFHALIQFQTDPKIAELTRQKSVAEFERFMQQGPEEKDFSAIKDKMIQKRTNDLKSNQWWVDTAMYGYYREGKIIADNYLNEIKNITLNDIATFTRQMINQGNVIDIMMIPK